MSRRTARLLLLITTLVLGVAGTVWPQGALPPDRWLARAQQRQEAGDLEGAMKEYVDLVDRFPESTVAPVALLRLAQGHLSLGDVPGARSACSRLVEGYPRTSEAAAASMLLGQILVGEASSREELMAAREAFKDSALAAAGTGDGRESRLAARVQGAELDLRVGELARAAADLVEVIDREPPSSWTARAHLALAEILLRQGDWLAAGELLQELISGADRFGEQASPSAAEAGLTLTLIHRLMLRPAAGEARWQSARSLGVALKRPVGVAARGDGELVIADRGLDEVLVVIGDRIESRRAQRGPSRPYWDRLTGPWAPSGTAVTNPRTGRSPTPGGTFVPGEIKEVVAGTAGDFGAYLVVKPGRVMFFDRQFDYVRVMPKDPPAEPEDIASDSEGRLYVLDGKGGAVYRLSPDGQDVERLVEGSTERREAIAVDRLGHLYVLDRQGGVALFDHNGDLLERVRLPGELEIRRPSDIAVDGTGRIFIADAAGAVQVLE